MSDEDDADCALKMWNGVKCDEDPFFITDYDW
jgi:hypothetical protein